MILLAIVLGLLFQVFAQPHWFGDFTRLWSRYCEVFATWHWLNRQSVLMQSVVLCAPMLTLTVLLWVLLSGFFWGLAGLFLLWLGFIVSADGFRFAQLLAQWETARQPQAEADNLPVNDPETVEETLLLDHTDAPDWEKVTVGSPLYYERIYGQNGSFDIQGSGQAIILTAMVALNLFLFVPFFWYVWLGPMGSLLICLGQAATANADMPMPLRIKIARVLRWVSWLPARAFSLTLFFVLRDRPVPVARWWSLVKSSQYSVEQVIKMTLCLLGEKESCKLHNPYENCANVGAFPSIWYYPVCLKILWLWVGATAFFTLIL